MRQAALPANVYAAQIAQLDNEGAALQGALAALSAELEQLRSATGAVQKIPASVDPWGNLSRDEQKQLLRHAIASCVVYREGGAVQVALAIQQC